MSTELPYIITERVIVDYAYNPAYGDERICACGHTYYRHFDPYEKMEAVGCKYCQCLTFIEKAEDNEEDKDEPNTKP